MKIDKQSSTSKSPLCLSQKLGWLITLAMTFVLGLATASDKGRDFRLNISQGIRNRLTSAAQSFTAPSTSLEGLPTLVINIDFASYTHILEQRARALQHGIYIPDEQDYTPAEIWAQGTAAPVNMRLAGPVERLGDDEKWGFEVLAEDEHQILDIRHGYLLDPAVNNGLNEWAFVQALTREGILAARYRFVRLIFNGDDRGVYALQEEPNAASLITRHWPEATSNRQDQQPGQGIVVRFNTRTLRRSIAHFQGNIDATYADPVSNLSATAFQYLEIASFYDAAPADDPAIALQREQALNTLHELQTGARQASEVFDVDSYGRFLALVDLWGATQATSLLNLHYYYNPNHQTLEPIGFNANALGSEARIDLSLTYNDPAIQAAYTREAHRISRPEYLNQLQEALEPELVQIQQRLASEYSNSDLLWAELSQNQAKIQRSLNPVQPVSAYLGDPAASVSGTLRIAIGNVLNLPVEIVGFDIAGATFLPLERQWISSNKSHDLLVEVSHVHDTSSTCEMSRMRGVSPTDSESEAVVLRAVDVAQTPIVVHYVHVEIPLKEIHHRDQEIDWMHNPDIHVITRISGLTHTQRTLARPSYHTE